MPPTISPQTTPYYGGGQVVNPANVINTVGAPSSAAYHNSLGTIAVDFVNSNAYVLVSIANNVASWFLMGGASAGLTGLEGDNAGTATPSGGVITISGGSTGLTTTGSGSTISTTGTLAVAHGGTSAATLTGVLTGHGTSAFTGSAVTQHGVLLGGASNAVSSLGVAATGTLLAGVTGTDPAFTGSPSVSGSLTAATTITATLGAITATNGNLVLGTAGNKLDIATGSNASIGTATLTTGTVTVATTAVSASSIILVSYNTCTSTLAAALSAPSASISAGVHFVINSEDATDSTSTVNWLIIN